MHQDCKLLLLRMPHVPASNVGFRLRDIARDRGAQPAVIELHQGSPFSAARQVDFAELDRDSDRIAAGLRSLGVPAGSRLVLAVPPGIDFVATVVAMLKARLVMILIDPGMPKRHLINCLAAAEPDGFIAPRRVHAIRRLLKHRFPQSRFHVVAGKPGWLDRTTLESLKRDDTARLPEEEYSLDDPAAVIFTTGSTGPPKGVRYDHRHFNQQIDAIRDRFGLKAGEIDLAAFPLFGLFNCMMGTTTVFPAMDYTRPAEADPRHILDVVRHFNITRSFGSPAFWNTVVGYCDAQHESLVPLKSVFSAGAPVPVHVLRRLLPRLADGGDVWTPYGATEALPLATIAGSQILEETAALTESGRGTCVGNRFEGIEWKVIAIDDNPIRALASVTELEIGQIGELIVRGEVVTREYVTRTDANALHKIIDGDRFWHRMGDVGYLDQHDRFWFCGRKSHRVITKEGTLFTVPCESIFNGHPRVFRSALVGIGEPPRQRPVLIIEPWPSKQPRGQRDWLTLRDELADLGRRHDHTRGIDTILWRKKLPTDIRHNAKIFREVLARWAAKRL